MSKFTKVYRKWHAKNNGKYDSAREYHKALMREFGDWQPPKPPKQLVEVPKFVADFIKNKKGDLKLYGAFHEIYKNMYGTDLYRWVSANNDRQEAFAKAWLDGYTVKKEQLYKVVFLKTDDDEILLLKSDTFFIDWISIYDDLKYQFTEKEIKDIDERYWAFAVPVDEVDQ